MTTRREFFRRTTFSVIPFMFLQTTTEHDMANMTGPMNDGAYKPVRLPAKPGATVAMTDIQRDAMEREIHCMCGCTLDIFTCRTTDFSCTVSPAMHRDVVSLVEGGYNKADIMSAFVKVYGEKVLMAPVKEGFNWAGYFVPFTVIAVGAVVILRNLRKWTSQNANDQNLDSSHETPVT